MAGGALGAGLGLLLGAGAGYERAKVQRSLKQKDAAAQMLLQMGIQAGDPGFFGDPDHAKLIDASFGKGFSKQAGDAIGALMKPLAGLPQPPNMGGGGTASPQQGAFKAGQGGGGQRTIGGGYDHTKVDSINDYLQQLEQFRSQHVNNPRVSGAIDAEIKFWDSQRTSLQKQQEFDITKSQQKEEFEQRQQQTKELAEEHMDVTRMIASSNEQFKQIMVSLKQEDSRDRAQVTFNTASAALGTRLDAISKGLQTSAPTDKATLDTELRKWNADARALRQQAIKNGFAFDPEAFAPVTSATLPSRLPAWLKTPTTVITSDANGADGVASPQFKAGDRRVKNGVTYERNDKGEWHPVSP